MNSRPQTEDSIPPKIHKLYIFSEQDLSFLVLEITSKNCLLRGVLGGVKITVITRPINKRELNEFSVDQVQEGSFANNTSQYLYHF